MKGKAEIVWSMDKTLVEMEESAGAVIWRCSGNQVFWKTAKFTEKDLHFSLFSMEFQALKPATLLKGDSSKDVFLWVFQRF